jgi:hypothetical protein
MDVGHAAECAFKQGARGLLAHASHGARLPVDEDGGCRRLALDRRLNVPRLVHPAHIGAVPALFNHSGTSRRPASCAQVNPWRIISMKGILLWLIGIPIPIIILLYLLF